MIKAPKRKVRIKIRVFAEGSVGLRAIFAPLEERKLFCRSIFIFNSAYAFSLRYPLTSVSRDTLWKKKTNFFCVLIQSLIALKFKHSYRMLKVYPLNRLNHSITEG